MMALIKDFSPSASVEPPRIDVVVIGRNESAHLRACLESVRALEYPRDRIHARYVDSESSDDSREIAAASGAEVIRLTGTPMTAARGRNAGWMAAPPEAGSLILFLDGDTQVHSGFLERAVDALSDPSIAAVWGHRREGQTSASVYNRILDLDWIYPPGFTEFFGGDVLVRRSALESVDGYNPELIAGEEPEMCRRLREKGWKILHIDTPMTSHDLRITHFSQYWRRSVRAGHAYAQVSSLFRHTGDPFWSAEARRNMVRGTMLILIACATLMGSLLLRSVWVLILAVSLYLLAAFRSAYKVRARSSSRATLLLFGLHSHFQEIPIFIGQMSYRIAKARRRKMTLIEYKRA